MLITSRYSVKDIVLWTRYEIFIFLAYSAIIAFMYEELGWIFLHVPWTPVAVLGTAVSFIVGFRNNAAYGRIWEARQIWGAIVNTSRTWGMTVRDTVRVQGSEASLTEDELKQERKTLVYRHIAWLTALRYSMRKWNPWEVQHNKRTSQEWRKTIYIPEEEIPLETSLKPYLSQEEYNYVLSKGNKQTALLYLQSSHIRKLKEKGCLWPFSFLILEKILEELFTHQGKSERIKNFPYPKQYASLSMYLVRIFVILLPFGIIPEFADIGDGMLEDFNKIGYYFVWLGVPFCAVVSWAFHVMERLAGAGENPFEGTPNDVPISTISRAIEINLREMLDEEPDEIPGQFPQSRNVQM